jgi:site-specific recombinase
VPQRLPDLTHLLEALDPGASRAERHLWLTALLEWVRAGMGSGTDPAGAVARVNLMLDAVQTRPQWRERWRAWWRLFKDTVDPAPLLADFGFAPRTAFMSALGERLRRKLLPITPDTYDLINLFDFLLPIRATRCGSRRWTAIRWTACSPCCSRRPRTTSGAMAF